MLRCFLRPPSASLVIAALLAVAAGCRAGDGTAGSTMSSGSTGTAGTGGSGAGGSGGGPPAGEPLRVLNWNARNFFNDIDDSTADGEEVVSAAEYQAKREAVADVLRALAPDVAVLQEIENLGVLEALNTMHLEGAYPHAALVDSADPRGIDVAALSKIPFDNVVSHLGDMFTKVGTNGPTYTFARDALELHLTVNGRHVVLIGVHFRSKGPPDDPDKRLAEAQHTRAIADGIAAADPTAAIAILGDFNDLPGSPPVNAVAGAGETAFDDVAMLLPSASRWTFNFNGSLELVDHQMANSLLRGMLDESAVEIPHGPEIDAASDHAPIVATYRISRP
jgi:predicted extracellular nuclease